MTRPWTILLLAVAIAVAPHSASAGGKEAPKEIKLDGTLALEDPKDTKRNTPCKVHVVPLKGGQSYVIHMTGINFDAYLRLEDKAGKELDEDDDSGGGLNAQIIFNCPKDGDYRVICTCFANGKGKYILSIKSKGVFTAAPAQSTLLGKPAPDFQGDFALNGKAVKLSDLKGNVVLIDFWAVNSGGSVAMLPRTSAWHKLHKTDGLEVVGVTYFNSELGHKLGFDPATGKLTEIDMASVETDRAMLKAFAAHHKLEHLLLALHKDKALKTFNDYLVNGLPHVVLIDRKGFIRFTFIGDSQVRNPEVDVQIKKLLEER